MNDSTPDKVERHFAATEPNRRGWYAFYACVLGMILASVLLPAFYRGSDPAESLSLLFLAVPITLLLCAGWVTKGRRFRSRQGVQKAWERVQLADWTGAQALLDEVMHRPIPSSSERGQAFMTLAAIAEHAGHYDEAAQVYETLLLRRIGDPVQLQRAQIALAAAKLRNEELTDAVKFIGRLEQLEMPVSLRAALDLVRLFQQVFMGHYEDALADFEERRSLFRRHLSTQAGFGYGLLAAALHHRGRTDDAARLWGDATTLIDADRLVEEYALLSTVSQAYPATKRPAAFCHTSDGAPAPMSDGTASHPPSGPDKADT